MIRQDLDENDEDGGVTLDTAVRNDADGKPSSLSWSLLLTLFDMLSGTCAVCFTLSSSLACLTKALISQFAISDSCVIYSLSTRAVVLSSQQKTVRLPCLLPLLS